MQLYGHMIFPDVFKGSTELQNTERVAIHGPVLSKPCYWTDRLKKHPARKS